MKKKFDKRRLLPALTLAALALAVLAPFGWFAARDAALDGRRLLSAKDAGLLGEAGQQNALARRLYLDRSKAAAGYETRPANADEAQWFADARRALEASALGVWMPEPAADAATAETAAGEKHELWVSEEGALRRVAQSFTGSGDGLVLIFASDGTLTGLQVNAAAPLAALELDKAADALAELAGLEAINDWQELPGKGYGEALASYSPGTQLYLHVNVDNAAGGGFATLGLASLPPDSVAADGDE